MEATAPKGAQPVTPAARRQSPRPIFLSRFTTRLSRVQVAEIREATTLFVKDFLFTDDVQL
jgi:hypothetical protein